MTEPMRVSTATTVEEIRAHAEANADPEKRYTPGSRKDWIQSLENRQVYPRELQIEQVGSIEEIAHALAGKFRFTCQTYERYSVAEHCVRGSHLVPAVFAGAFLLHELSETYLPDVASPLKAFVQVIVADCGNGLAGAIPWSELERRHTHTMLAALKLSSLEPLIYCGETKRLDWAMLAAEKRDLCGPEPEDWHLPHPPAMEEIIRPWSPGAAESAFLSRFRELFGAGYGKATSAPSSDIPF